MAANTSQNSSKMAFILVVLLLTLAGGGAGLAVGAMLEFPAAPELAKTPKPATPPADSTPPGHGASDGADHQPADEAEPLPKSEMKVMPFPPVLTTLAAPKGIWIRIEGSLLLAKETEDNPEILVEKAGTQILTYLRTARLAQIEGPSGFLHLREDLNNTVSALSGGQVREVLVHTMVVE